MADLVTLDEAKEFLRVDSDDEDATIYALIAAASDAVSEIATEWDGTGEPPARLKLAVLARLAVTYDERTDLRPGNGEMPMLMPFRELEV
jgi:hypothetical protein